MDAVQRRGSAARMNYIKRFLSVLVAFVLCLGLIQPPRAKANAAAVALATGGALTLSPAVAAGAVILCVVLSACGIDFIQGYLDIGDKGLYGTGGYEVGYKLRTNLESLGGDLYDWLTTQEARVTAAGGFSAGMQFDVPAELTEYARQWASQNYDFSSGAISITQDGILDADGNFLMFTKLPGSTVPDGSSVYYDYSLGAVFGNGSMVRFSSSESYSVRLNNRNLSVYNGDVRVSLFSTYTTSASMLLFSYDSHVVPGVYDYNTNSGRNCVAVNASNLNKYVSYDDILLLESSLSATDVLDIPVSKDITVAIPSDVPMGKVGELDIPAVNALTKGDVLVGEDVDNPPINPPIEDVDTMVGDIAIEGIQTAAQDKGLGALFISKFPFCIPWDFVNAVKLLAAPPKTPYWEVDFLEPISGRYGGALGDTTIYIDFSDYELLGQLSRWITTFLFVTMLMMGTKRLIWTA